MATVSSSSCQITITSSRNPLVKKLRSLTKRSGRAEHRCLLLEGTHLLEELLRQTTKYDRFDLVATESWLNSHKALLALCPPRCTVQSVTYKVLQAALTTQQPDGVATICPLSHLPQPPALKLTSFALALDRLQDPGNVGSLLRTALAADVNVVWQAGGADILAPKVLRSSAGAVLQIPIERLGLNETDGLQSLAQRLQHAARVGLQIVATLVPGPSSVRPVLPYWEIDWRRPTVLVLGNEGSGLNPQLIACCSHLVTIPHSMRMESLNVAAAAVPLLLERQRAIIMSSTRRSSERL
ncbi:RNA methyltransferase [cyanobiont of Ornithocercus magnificus]|nr:RNA methyltransferase [cyanobiont of Ornithocercus magnificus]